MAYRKKGREFVRGFGYAFAGLKALFASEVNALIHAVVAAAVIVAGVLLNLATWEWVAVTFAMGLVLAAEAFNTAIERLCDRVTRENDDLIGETKDLAAGAVLIAVIAAVAVGLIVFLPKI